MVSVHVTYDRSKFENNLILFFCMVKTITNKKKDFRDLQKILQRQRIYVEIMS